jgi:hypothetical protein
MTFSDLDWRPFGKIENAFMTFSNNYSVRVWTGEVGMYYLCLFKEGVYSQCITENLIDTKRLKGVSGLYSQISKREVSSLLRKAEMLPKEDS